MINMIQNAKDQAAALAMSAYRAAVADGLIFEVHNDPAHARCDGPQSITPDAFERLARRLGKIRAALAD